jgi:hypothetical protein
MVRDHSFAVFRFGEVWLRWLRRSKSLPVPLYFLLSVNGRQRISVKVVGRMMYAHPCPHAPSSVMPRFSRRMRNFQELPRAPLDGKISPQNRE